MASLTKIVIAVVLAVVAFALNMIILNSGEKPKHFTRAKKDIPANNKVTVSDIEPFPLSGDAEELKKTFIPYTSDGMGQILGSVATRDYKPGDPILRRDLPTAAPPMDVLGPFRLLSVGEALLNNNGEVADRSRRENTVTIAVKGAKGSGSGRYEFKDEAARKLLQIVDMARNRQTSNKDSRLRIVSVVLMPNDATGIAPVAGAASGGLAAAGGPSIGFGPGTASEGATDDLGLGPDEIALIVPLNNVEILPGLLMRGNHIGFVTPAYR